MQNFASHGLNDDRPKELDALATRFVQWVVKDGSSKEESSALLKGIDHAGFDPIL